MTTRTTPPGEPVDVAEAVADIRRARQAADPMTLQVVKMGEDFARQLVVDFPDREDWPLVARAVLVSSSMNMSLAADVDKLRPMMSVAGINYLRSMLNVACVGSVELLDRYDIETDEATRKPGVIAEIQRKIAATVEGFTYREETLDNVLDAALENALAFGVGYIRVRFQPLDVDAASDRVVGDWLLDAPHPTQVVQVAATDDAEDR